MTYFNLYFKWKKIDLCVNKEDTTEFWNWYGDLISLYNDAYTQQRFGRPVLLFACHCFRRLANIVFKQQFNFCFSIYSPVTSEINKTYLLLLTVFYRFSFWTRENYNELQKKCLLRLSIIPCEFTWKIWEHCKTMGSPSLTCEPYG